MDLECWLREDYCTACEGACCKHLPGHAAPQDFGITKGEIEDGVRQALRSGKWQIDMWSGKAALPKSERKVHDPYLIRPTCLDGNEDRTFSYSWGGRRIFLTDKGCTLEPSARPYECRMLEPRPNGECKKHYVNKLSTAEMWIESAVDLESLGNEIASEKGE